MGGNSSKGAQLAGVRVIKKQADNTLLGDISQVQLSNSSQHAIMKIWCTFDQTEHKNNLRRLKQRKAKQHHSLLKLYLVEERILNELCGTTYRLHCGFECYDHDLEYEYNHKKTTRKQFGEQELVQIVGACAKGLVYIQDNDLKRYHLSKKSIVTVNHSYKLLDQALVERQHPYYQLLGREIISDDIFLAPEIMAQLQKQESQPYFSPKSDIFTLGMLALHLALLQPIGYLYDYDKFTIDFKGLKVKINNIRQSQRLKQLVTYMLDPVEETRPGLLSLQQFLECGGKKSHVKPKLQIQIDSNQPTVIRNTQGSRTSINMHSTFNMDTVRVSDDQLPSCLVLPPSTSSAAAPNSIQNNTDMSSRRGSIINHLGTEDAENTLSFGDSPIRKMNGLMEATYRPDQLQYGRLVYSHGGYYEGELKQGFPHGNGVLYYRNGKVHYSGSWSQNHFDGFGTIHNFQPLPCDLPFDPMYLDHLDRFWLRYEGQFKNDLKQGFGTLFFSNGQRYSGCFKHDCADGYGTYYCRDNRNISGIWKNNRLQL